MNGDEVIGQDGAMARLTQMADNNKLPHALLFTGPEGCGKMAVALAFASYLLCDGSKRINPNLNIANARAMAERMEHPDLHFTFPTIKLPSMGSSHQPISLDFIKEWNKFLKNGAYFTFDKWMAAIGAENQQGLITGAESDELGKTLSLKSCLGGYKVSVIWLPERMNATSANKLLKLLEEPPSQTVFLMVCEKPELLLDTIVSRTQRIALKGIDREEMERALVERRGLEPVEAERIARIANGSWTKALETLDTGNENRMFLDMFSMLMRLAYMRDIKELKKWSDSVSMFGREQQRRLLTYFNRMFRENFMYNFRKPELTYMTTEEENFSKKFSPYINEGNIIELMELTDRAYRDIGQNANAKIVLFDYCLKLIVLILRK